jgi:hypothetical protein
MPDDGVTYFCCRGSTAEAVLVDSPAIGRYFCKRPEYGKNETGFCGAVTEDIDCKDVSGIARLEIRIEK